MTDPYKFYKFRKNIHSKSNDKDGEDLIYALVKSYENYERILFETNLKIRKIESELKENINIGRL